MSLTPLAYSLYNRLFTSVKDKLLDLNHLIISHQARLQVFPFLF